MPKKRAVSKKTTIRNTPERRVLVEDEMVQHLAPDNVKDSNAVMLTGFLSRGAKKDRWRLYRAPEMRDFVEFDEKDILHTHKTTSEMVPGTGSVVWLRSDSKLAHHASSSRKVAAEFLSGDIVDDNGVGAADSFVDPGGQTAITWTITVTVTVTLTTTLIPRPKCDHTHPHPDSAQSKCLCPD